MFREHKHDSHGSVYVEMLVAFFGWLVLLGTIVPVLLMIQMERKTLLIENEAQSILAEQVVQWTIGAPLDRHVQGRYVPVYEIRLVHRDEQSAICVYYPDAFHQERKICQSLPG
mgnify:CR=1 FL=1